MAYQAIDANSSIITVDSSIISGSGVTGTQRPIVNIAGSTPSSLLSGIYGHRNDAIASFLGGNLSWNPLATDSAGRIITKPFAPNESLVSGVASVVSASVTQLLAVAGAGLRNYVTDILVANTGSVVTQVTFRDGDASIIGRTLAPATGGSNIHLGMPMRTGGLNHQVDIVAGTSVSVLTVSAYGYKAP